MLRLKNLLTEQNVKPSIKLPGPNYYQIQKFLEKKTGHDTGEAGFGDESAQALGIYLFGKNKNPIKGKGATKKMSDVLTRSGYDTGGEEFGPQYAGAVSDIIQFVENNAGSVEFLLNNKNAKQFIINQINGAIVQELPYKDAFFIGELNGKKPGGSFTDLAWEAVEALRVTYQIDSIRLNDYDSSKKIFKATISGWASLKDFSWRETITGTGTIKYEIKDDRYIKLKLIDISVSTGYDYLSTKSIRTAIIAASAFGGPWALAAGLIGSRMIPDVGYQLKNNQLRLNFAANLNPLWPGYTKWGPYYYNTDIRRSILDNVYIPTIDIEDPAIQDSIRPLIHMIK